MDPLSSNCSFQGLLNSQQPNHPFPFVPREPSVEISSSNASAFDRPWSEDANEDEHIVSDRKVRKKWTPVEDLVLISAWLNTSKDPVVGNQQKAEAFWKRIANYVAASPKFAGLEKREASNCKQRWLKINEGVCKFVGCYEAACRQRGSGCSDDDVLSKAYGFYFSDNKANFTLEHAWLELRHDQKWCGAPTTKNKVSSKRRKVDDQGAQSSNHVAGEEEARPIGVKAAKSKGKSKSHVSEEAVEFKGLWEIKQKDFEQKEKLSQQKVITNKHKLLTSLIAKTENLSELEVALKNKLITEML